jgi:hypothetical protein
MTKAIFGSPRPKTGIAMGRFTRAFMSVLLLAAVGLAAGCGGISGGKFDLDAFWEKQKKEAG